MKQRSSSRETFFFSLPLHECLAYSGFLVTKQKRKKKKRHPKLSQVYCTSRLGAHGAGFYGSGSGTIYLLAAADWGGPGGML